MCLFINQTMPYPDVEEEKAPLLTRDGEPTKVQNRKTKSSRGPQTLGLIIKITTKFGSFAARVDRAGRSSYNIRLQGYPGWTVRVIDSKHGPERAGYVASSSLASSILATIYKQDMMHPTSNGELICDIYCTMGTRDGCNVGDAHWPNYQAIAPEELGMYLASKISFIGEMFSE